MNRTKSALLITIHQLCRQRQAHYCTPSPAALLSLLERHHSITIKPRWLCQCLADLEESGLISRRFRFRQSAQRGIYQLPSLISVTMKGAHHLFKKCVAGAGDLLNAIMKFIRSSDRRFPFERSAPASAPPFGLAAASALFPSIINTLSQRHADAHT